MVGMCQNSNMYGYYLKVSPGSENSNHRHLCLMVPVYNDFESIVHLGISEVNLGTQTLSSL